MKCNAVILASFVLGQSVMATNIYRPGGHYQVRAFNESEPIFPSGTGASSGLARPTGKPSHTKSKKPCKTKSSSAVASSVAATSAAVTSSEASVVTSAPAHSSDLATPSTVLYTTTLTNHLSETVVVTVTPKPATSTSEASTSTTAAVVPTTLKSADVDTSSTFVAPSSKTSANSLPPYPTTLSTGTSSTIASTGFASGTGGVAYPTGSTIAAYYQCGGIGYTGSTTCVEGTHCQVQNPYYSQCIYQS
ncbi:hypothetical protein BPOR_0882g00050 [Botrytis porri]|uniref:CBM1 domain-containing protein n=1 Tax=Botrytis porri TaxID=87229 RepID=A0A4Z1K9A3_9HELO|nr:hypothetical protein BPOR_0882g00050 [Botrytis porri]